LKRWVSGHISYFGASDTVAEWCRSRSRRQSHATNPFRRGHLALARGFQRALWITPPMRCLHRTPISVRSTQRLGGHNRIPSKSSSFPTTSVVSAVRGRPTSRTINRLCLSQSKPLLRCRRCGHLSTAYDLAMTSDDRSHRLSCDLEYPCSCNIHISFRCDIRVVTSCR
jgi:hypothetical protein